MRFHSSNPLLQLWLPEKRTIVRRETLALARLEPAIVEGAEGGLVLDLTFFDGASTAVIPFIAVQATYLIQRERTPLVWPQAARMLGCDVLESLERELLPWLQARVLARQENQELIRAFCADAQRERFDAARRAGFLGAARYADVMPAFAPYVYAARFCEGRTAGIEDAQGASGAALLATRAKSVRANLGSADLHALAESWFPRAIFGDLDREYDVVVAQAGSAVQARDARVTLDSAEDEGYAVEVASAVPVDVLVSFDRDDAPVARTLTVRVDARVQLRDARPAEVPKPAGGSSGAILMLMRDGFERAPDADVDEARELASRLRAEGFTAELASPSSLDRAGRIDLVHAFGASAPEVQAALERLRAGGVPVVLNPALSALGNEALTGPQVLLAAYRRAADDGVLDEYLDLLALRKLSTETERSSLAAAGALRQADVVIAASAGEEAQARAAGFAGEIVRYAPAGANPGQPPASIAPIAGFSPFVFVHAPVEWRTNLPLLARVTARRGIPLVVAGAAPAVSALRVLQQTAPELFVHLPRAGEGELEALYRSARVYADVSWAGAGYARLARAAACGCRLLVSRGSYAGEIWPDAAAADPGSVESLAAAFEAAWDAPEAPQPIQGPDLFSAAVFAYSRAVQARQPA